MQMTPDLRFPLVSSLDAVLTVSPNRQYRGIVRPTTPATQGPIFHIDTCVGLHRMLVLRPEMQVNRHVCVGAMPLNKEDMTRCFIQATGLVGGLTRLLKI